MNDFLTKPFEPELLTAAIVRALNLSPEEPAPKARSTKRAQLADRSPREDSTAERIERLGGHLKRAKFESERVWQGLRTLVEDHWPEENIARLDQLTANCQFRTAEKLLQETGPK